MVKNERYIEILTHIGSTRSSPILPQASVVLSQMLLEE